MCHPKSLSYARVCSEISFCCYFCRIDVLLLLWTDAPINCNFTFSAVNKCSQSDILMDERGASRFSSDLSTGHRPMSKSDEKRDVPLLLIEIWMLQLFTFSKDVYHLLEHQSEARGSVWLEAISAHSLSGSKQSVGQITHKKTFCLVRLDPASWKLSKRRRGPRRQGQGPVTKGGVTAVQWKV